MFIKSSTGGVGIKMGVAQMSVDCMQFLWRGDWPIVCLNPAMLALHIVHKTKQPIGNIINFFVQFVYCIPKN